MVYGIIAKSHQAMGYGLYDKQGIAIRQGKLKQD